MLAVRSVRNCCSTTSTFPITVGLSQGSILSLYLFILIMDEVRADIHDVCYLWMIVY